MEYMNLLETEEVFRFCAIPQVMAIATLSDLYNNPLVFTGVVKIRKGLAAKLILDTTSFGGLHKWFNVFARDILKRVDDSDPNANKTIAICNTIIGLTDKHAKIAIAGSYAQVCATIAPVIAVVSSYYLFGSNIEANFPYFPVLKTVGASGKGVVKPNSSILFPLTCFITSTLFIFGYSLVVAGRKGLRRADKY
jgi:hypothetical protein